MEFPGIENTTFIQILMKNKLFFLVGVGEQTTANNRDGNYLFTIWRKKKKKKAEKKRTQPSSKKKATKQKENNKQKKKTNCSVRHGT